MGRTNPTFRNTLRKLRDHWQDYRRALRHDDQHHFDRMWTDAENHADAADYLNPDNPMTAVLFSICLEQERKINQLKQELTGTPDVQG